MPKTKTKSLHTKEEKVHEKREDARFKCMTCSKTYMCGTSPDYHIKTVHSKSSVAPSTMFYFIKGNSQNQIVCHDARDVVWALFMPEKLKVKQYRGFCKAYSYVSISKLDIDLSSYQ